MRALLLAHALTMAAAAAVTLQRIASSAHKPLAPRWSVPFHKGQHGRVLVIGGSEEYTGAPYYAAASALKTGADLVHIACAPAAATPLKAYSPEVVVHAVLPSGTARASVAADGETAPEGLAALAAILPRVSAVVLGPGLGRAEPLGPLIDALLPLLAPGGAGRDGAAIPTVIDADGLWFAAARLPALVGAEHVVLTPNAAELRRLATAASHSDSDELRLAWAEAEAAATAAGVGAEEAAAIALSAALQGVAVLAKGATDTLVAVRRSDDGASGTVAHVGGVAEPASPRRCGGQGDVLAGALGTQLSWAATGEAADGSALQRLPHTPLPRLLAALHGAALGTRAAAAAAFASTGRGTTTPDVLAAIPAAFAAAGLEPAAQEQ